MVYYLVSYEQSLGFNVEADAEDWQEVFFILPAKDRIHAQDLLNESRLRNALIERELLDSE